MVSSSLLPRQLGVSEINFRRSGPELFVNFPWCIRAEEKLVVLGFGDSVVLQSAPQNDIYSKGVCLVVESGGISSLHYPCISRPH